MPWWLELRRGDAVFDAGLIEIPTIFLDGNRRWRTGWRIVAMFALIVATAVFIDRAWSAAGLPNRQEGGPWFFLLRAVLVSGSSFGIVMFLLRRIEQEGSAAIRLPFESDTWKATVAGTLLGAVPVSLFVALAMIFSYGSLTLGSSDTSGLVMTLLPVLVAGFLLAAWEELTLRGYLLRQLSLGLSPAASIMITGILFGLMHSGNPGANWQGLLFTAIGGILMGWLVIRSGSLWLLIGYHFGWNATASALFGLELSGFEGEVSVLVTTLSGPDWLTGGGYGFEATPLVATLEVLTLSLALRVASRPRNSAAVLPPQQDP